MHVLHIGKYYEPNLGGIENHMYNLCHELKKDIKVTALVYNTTNRTEIYTDRGVKVYKIATLAKFRSQPLALQMKKFVKELSEDADIIHIHTPNPLAEYALVTSNINKPIVVSYHSDIVKQKLLLKAYMPYGLKLLDKADAIIAGSRKYANSSSILKRYRNKLRIIPLGIDPNISKHFSNEDVLKIKHKYGDKIVLFAGRLIYYKGVEYLIEAFRECQEYSLLIIGTGDLENKLIKKVKDLNLKNVYFLGKVKNLIPYYQACDIFVLPSIERSESFGVVQLEAMACNRAVICTEINTGTSFVNKNKETGFVIKPQNSSELTKAIKFLFNHPTIRIQYGKNARKRVLKFFTIKNNTKENLKVYKDVLSKRKKW